MIHIYCFSSLKTIIVSDRPSDNIKDKYGHRYEILTSIKERDSVSIVLPRVIRSYSGYTVIEWYTRKKRGSPSAETRAKIAAARLGVARSIASNMKASATMKGRSNFKGKKHTIETRDAIASKMIGNDHASGLIWCHDPVSGEEKRIADLVELPAGWVIGREFYSIEHLAMYR